MEGLSIPPGCTPVFRGAPSFSEMNPHFQRRTHIVRDENHFQTRTPFSEMYLCFQRCAPTFRKSLPFPDMYPNFRNAPPFSEMHPIVQGGIPISRDPSPFPEMQSHFPSGKTLLRVFLGAGTAQEAPSPQPQLCTKQLGTAIRAALLRNQNRDAVLPSRPQPELTEEVTQARGKDLRVLSALCFCPSKGTRQGHLGSLRGSLTSTSPPPSARQWGGESKDMALEVKRPQ